MYMYVTVISMHFSQGPCGSKNMETVALIAFGNIDLVNVFLCLTIDSSTFHHYYYLSTSSLPVFFSPFHLAPTAVLNPRVTPYPNFLCASWEPPMDDGGAPIDSYHLELRNSTGGTEQNIAIGADTLFHSFENLVANTSYT